MWKNLGGQKQQKSNESKPEVNLQKTMTQWVKKQERLEQDRDELARIIQMLIDELNEWEDRVKVAENVIGDLKNSDLIDILTRN